MAEASSSGAPIAPNETAAARAIRGVLRPLEQRVQHLVDRMAPHRTGRWAGLVGLLFLYAAWVWFRPGWYIVTYGLGIYLLNLLVSFVSPVEDPSAGDGRPLLPVGADETEAKPMQTKLPELKCWRRGVQGILSAWALTLVPALNVPVFWPILLLYFVVLFAYTCRRQIGHMVRWRYVPFAGGKKTYRAMAGGFAKDDGKIQGGPTFADKNLTSGGGKWRAD